MNKIKDNLSIILMAIFGGTIAYAELIVNLSLLETIGAVTVSFLIAWAVEVKVKQSNTLTDHIIFNPEIKKPEGELDQNDKM